MWPTKKKILTVKLINLMNNLFLRHAQAVQIVVPLLKILQQLPNNIDKLNKENPNY